MAGQVTCIWSLSLISHSGCRHQSSRPSTPPWSVSPVSCHGLQGSLPEKSNAGPAAWSWAAEPVSRAALSPTSVSRQESTALGAKLGQELPLDWSKARSTASAGLGAKLGQGHHIRCIARHRATHALCLNAPRNHPTPAGMPCTAEEPVTPCSMFLRPLDQCLQALRGTLMHDPMHDGPLAVSVLASNTHLGLKGMSLPQPSLARTMELVSLASQKKKKTRDFPTNKLTN